jgi:peptidoglycan/LPS O-acetylase OafA/YrhL
MEGDVRRLPRMDSGDGLRAIAALTVVGYHVLTTIGPAEGGIVDLPAPLMAVGLDLRFGLILFFVLSGFLLARPRVAALLDGTAQPPLRRYLRHRLLRILPAYWVVLALTGLVLGSAVLGPGRLGTFDDPGLVLRDALLVQSLAPGTLFTGIGPAWTLTTELCFYLLLPALAWAVGRVAGDGVRAAWALPLVLVGVGLTARLALAVGGERLGAWQLVAGAALPAWCDAFGWGAAAALVQVLALDGRLRIPRPVARGLLPAGALVLAALVAIGGERPLAIASLEEAFVAPACALILLAVALPGAPAPRAAALLRWRPLAATGVAAFSVYLWHTPLLYRLDAWGMDATSLGGLLLAAAVVAVPTAVLSALTFRFVERPALALAHREPVRLRPLPSAS